MWQFHVVKGKEVVLCGDSPIGCPWAEGSMVLLELAAKQEQSSRAQRTADGGRPHTKNSLRRVAGHGTMPSSGTDSEWNQNTASSVLADEA